MSQQGLSQPTGPHLERRAKMQDPERRRDLERALRYPINGMTFGAVGHRKRLAAVLGG